MGIRETISRWFPDSGDYVARNMPGMLNQRDALGAMQIAYTVGKPVLPKRNAAVYDEQAYRKIALVFRCINVIANSIGSAPIRVYDRGKDQQLTEMPAHPMRKLLERPNPNMGETVFWATVNTTMAAFRLLRDREGTGRQGEAWSACGRCAPTGCSPVPRSDGKRRLDLQACRAASRRADPQRGCARAPPGHRRPDLPAHRHRGARSGAAAMVAARHDGRFSQSLL
jgi:hypothetical protein